MEELVTDWLMRLDFSIGTVTIDSVRICLCRRGGGGQATTERGREHGIGRGRLLKEEIEGAEVGRDADGDDEVEYCGLHLIRGHGHGVFVVARVDRGVVKGVLWILFVALVRYLARLMRECPQCL